MAANFRSIFCQAEKKPLPPEETTSLLICGTARAQCLRNSPPITSPDAPNIPALFSLFLESPLAAKPSRPPVFFLGPAITRAIFGPPQIGIFLFFL